MSKFTDSDLRKIAEKLKELAAKHDYGDPITFRFEQGTSKIAEKWCLIHKEWE